MTTLCLIVPGFLRTPSYYDALVNKLNDAGLSTLSLDPLGARAPLHGCVTPSDFAEHYSKTLPKEESYFIIGHSWGGHVARSLAMLCDDCRLFEIDSRITPTEIDSAWLDDVPEGFANHEDLVQTYAKYGVSEPDIDMTLWIANDDGGYRLGFDKVAGKAVLENPTPIHPLAEWPNVAHAQPTYFAAQRESFNTNADFAKAETALGDGFVACPWLTHAFDSAAQKRVAKEILKRLS